MLLLFSFIFLCFFVILDMDGWICRIILLVFDICGVMFSVMFEKNGVSVIFGVLFIVVDVVVVVLDILVMKNLLLFILIIVFWLFSVDICGLDKIFILFCNLSMLSIVVKFVKLVFRENILLISDVLLFINELKFVWFNLSVKVLLLVFLVLLKFCLNVFYWILVVYLLDNFIFSIFVLIRICCCKFNWVVFRKFCILCSLEGSVFIMVMLEIGFMIIECFFVFLIIMFNMLCSWS